MAQSQQQLRQAQESLHQSEKLAALGQLGFLITRGDPWTVTPPSWRRDVEGPADLVEEVARIEGYGALPSTPLPDLGAPSKGVLNPRQARVRLARRALQLALGPGEIAVEPGDVLRFPDGPEGRFLVQAIEDGFERRLTLRAFAGKVSAPITVVEPGRVPDGGGAVALMEDVDLVDDTVANWHVVTSGWRRPPGPDSQRDFVGYSSWQMRSDSRLPCDRRVRSRPRLKVRHSTRRNTVARLKLSQTT